MIAVEKYEHLRTRYLMFVFKCNLAVMILAVMGLTMIFSRSSHDKVDDAGNHEDQEENEEVETF